MYIISILLNNYPTHRSFNYKLFQKYKNALPKIFDEKSSWIHRINFSWDAMESILEVTHVRAIVIIWLALFNE